MTDIIIEQLPKYDGYKDSGVEWLGELPNEWSVTPLKFVLALISEKESSKNSQLPYLGMENIESWTGKIISGESEVEGLASRFFANDILFGKLRPYLAKVALMEDDGICSTELLVYRAKSNPEFFKYLLGSELFISLVNASTYGSKMPRANSNFIGNQKLPIPSQDEMVAISSYLDNKTTQINEAIAIKRKQIELLKERKQIIIQQAVTQGLTPDVPMKDSGVDWIGTIPEHWDIAKFPNSTAKCDTLQYQAAKTISSNTMAGCLNDNLSALKRTLYPCSSPSLGRFLSSHIALKDRQPCRGTSR